MSNREVSQRTPGIVISEDDCSASEALGEARASNPVEGRPAAARSVDYATATALETVWEHLASSNTAIPDEDAALLENLLSKAMPSLGRRFAMRREGTEWRPVFEPVLLRDTFHRFASLGLVGITPIRFVVPSATGLAMPIGPVAQELGTTMDQVLRFDRWIREVAFRFSEVLSLPAWEGLSICADEKRAVAYDLFPAWLMVVIAHLAQTGGMDRIPLHPRLQ